MKRKYFNKLRIVLSSVVIISYILFINSFKESSENVNSFSEILSYNELISFIEQSVQENGYGKTSLDYTILPGKNVEIIIKLADENMDDSIKNEVHQIAIESIISYSFDPQYFRISITDYTTM
ncbi:hypothetical protein [Psychrobacillus sp.]|uniref:hypothetical protein n=1 Tax=Psychrobacillus sp. TaxID=1871623 RepID=UPI0028BEB6C9|nr:hypothetical protein [Psychrobacillus sp.]